MAKRIMAWVLLIGFVLFIVNILFIHKYMATSLMIYAVVVLTYWFVLRKKK